MNKIGRLLSTCMFAVLGFVFIGMWAVATAQSKKEYASGIGDGAGMQAISWIPFGIAMIAFLLAFLTWKRALKGSKLL